MIDKGKVLIEGMDLSGKSTISSLVKDKVLDIKKLQQRTLSDKTEIYNFAVAQSKMGNLSDELISNLYCLAVEEDLFNYKVSENGIILQDSYFALRSHALAKHNKNLTLCDNLYRLLKVFPKPELAFYLTASTEERIRRNAMRNKPMAYMERLLMVNPNAFQDIENNLRDVTSDLFNIEVIDTQTSSPEDIASHIVQKIENLTM